MAAEKLEKLSDCPFCGAHFIEIRYNDERRRYYGYCITCMSKSTECADYGIAVSQWNRRPDTIETGATFHQQSDAIAALRAEVQQLREVVGQHQSFVGLHQKLGGNSTRL